VVVAAALVSGAAAFRLARPWSTRHWCEVVTEPHWPFAYAKTKLQEHEYKGRTATNLQHTGHECVMRGARSKCHRCEDIACESTFLDGEGNRLCNYQLQGVDWDELPKNIPTISNVPWAVGPNARHRNDFGRAHRICVMLSGEKCIIDKATTNFEQCSVRCVGHNFGDMSGFIAPTEHGWAVPLGVEAPGKPQGWVGTYAGVPSAVGGHQDGAFTVARFNDPQALVVDRARDVYVADTGNNVIRKISRGIVSTFAGVVPVKEGFADGDARTAARFAAPKGITLYYDDSDVLVVVVADTNNHRIRLIRQGVVSTLAGDQKGLADGIGVFARFDTPHGIAATDDGVIFVADTLNFLIRRVFPDGTVDTIAGNTTASPHENAGCPPPCLDGIPGSRDGPLRYAQFYHPYDVAIGPNNTVVVSDGDRIRRITGTPDETHEIQGVASKARVVTIAGGFTEGTKDGVGWEAEFNKPRGVVVSADNRIYVADTVACRIRRITPSRTVARTLTCTDRLVDVIRPEGCDMYDPPVDNIDRKATPVSSNIHYNYLQEYLEENGDKYSRVGKRVPVCVGVPEPDLGIESNGITDGANGGTLSKVLDIKEDTGDETTLRFICPPRCGELAINLQNGADGKSGVDGSGIYADYSTICAAAVHDGVITNGGGMISVQLQRGFGEAVASFNSWTRNYGTKLNGTLQNGIQSGEVPNGWWRTFTIEPYLEATVEVETLSGHPNAPLDDPCGHEDMQPPQYARYHRPTAVALYTHASLTHQEWLYIADAGNNVIRSMTAVCSKVCENGGRCTADEKCTCATGWRGDDCTIPICDNGCFVTGARINRVCTAPNICTCKPGYRGDSCNVPMCVQTCHNGASCVAPDTCQCTHGWFDPNCTTPVCAQTCGNGGNCTAPDTCDCPSDWQGNDCRTPVCSQTCGPHGHCIAPHTCECHIGWSGHDCSKPVCTQGFFRPDPVERPSYSPSPWREPWWRMYTPCNISAWCEATGTFDCDQLRRNFEAIEVPPWRDKTGWGEVPGECHIMELAVTLPVDPNLGRTQWTPYRYEQSDWSLTPYARETPNTQYEWGPRSPDHYSAYKPNDRHEIISGLQGFDPWSFWGPNGEQPSTGTLPHLIEPGADSGLPGYNPWSSPGVAALDRQIALVSWQNVTQGVYVCANGGNCTAPETCVCADGWIGYDCRTPICNQGWYEPELPDARYPGQGTYECSHRSLTLWENRLSPTGKFQGYMHDHPNYYSRYMNESHGWDTAYVKTAPLFDDTVEGWRRDGWWEQLDEVAFTKGAGMRADLRCQPFYNRTCPETPRKSQDLRIFQYLVPVDDTQLAFEERVNYSIWTAQHIGRWDERGGECIDEVLDGCYNNGTCIAPDTCRCAPGWEGHDCSIPICEQSVKDIVTGWGMNSTQVVKPNGQVIDLMYRECPNNGNCTRPNECTCEKGWEGPDCKIPICAQDCANGGKCVKPDQCQCVRYPNTFRDGRDGGGRPLFQQDNGDPQLSGWTGFDCNTPICVQAERWVANDVRGTVVLEKTRNNGESFQSGCPQANEFTPPNRNRSSNELCRVLEWYEGHYQESWQNVLGESFDSKGRTVRINHVTNFELDPILDKWKRLPDEPGEGLYACFNTGSCVAPDTCACSDGWTGYDCNTPLCRHINYNQLEVSCLNNGICANRDNCTCIQSPSILHHIHPDEPEAITGFTGTDCAIAICTQGFYDPECVDVPPFDNGVSSGGEGCYRCANGGNCTGPDFCTCTNEWSGYDCRTPVCTATADAITVFHLDTVDAAKIQDFELDPCGQSILEEYNGALVGKGNCSAPNTCTCLCKDRTWLDEDNELVELPWIDPLERELPPGYEFGFSDCLDGYQGTLNDDGSFRTCHLAIYVPTTLERFSLTFIVLGTILGVGLLIFYYFLRRKLRERYMLAKAERRRSRRSSEEQQRHKPSAFGHE